MPLYANNDFYSAESMNTTQAPEFASQLYTLSPAEPNINGNFSSPYTAPAAFSLDNSKNMYPYGSYPYTRSPLAAPVAYESQSSAHLMVTASPDSIHRMSPSSDISECFDATTASSTYMDMGSYSAPYTQAVPAAPYTFSTAPTFTHLSPAMVTTATPEQTQYPYIHPTYIATDVPQYGPFACGQCNRLFDDRTQLEYHYATHISARPFKCDVCASSFSRKHDLRRHQKIHSGLRPYKCQKCGSAFGRLDALKRHSTSKKCCTKNPKQS